VLLDDDKPARRFAYDPACEILARHFLHGAYPTDVPDLAQTIQNAVEGWFAFRDDDRGLTCNDCG
jgi:hypothetical protein